VDTIPDPLTLEPLEDRLSAWTPNPDDVTDAELLRTVGRRGALRLLVASLLPRASRRHRESFYRRLLQRRRRIAQRTATDARPTLEHEPTEARTLIRKAG
jgi:hypothetical protein